MKLDLIACINWLRRCPKCRGRGFRKTWNQGKGKFTYSKCVYCNGNGKRKWRGNQ